MMKTKTDFDLADDTGVLDSLWKLVSALEAFSGEVCCIIIEPRLQTGMGSQLLQQVITLEHTVQLARQNIQLTCTLAQYGLPIQDVQTLDLTQR